ncbi:MAG: hypothetical protein MUO87_06430 [Thermoplasmata archaeon]|nr:hypothetical protein [Thermoplasmata archaeon]
MGDTFTVTQPEPTQPAAATRKPRRVTSPKRRLAAFIIGSAVLVASLSVIVLLAPSHETATIAVILPIEDEWLSHTDEIVTAMAMAVDELNKWGGIGNVRMELAVEETGEPGKGARFEMLVQEGYYRIGDAAPPGKESETV